MPDEEHRRDFWTALQETNRQLHVLLSKFAAHDESHKAIDRHMEDVRKTLWTPEGLVGQARDCFNYRDTSRKLLEKNTALTEEIRNTLAQQQGEAAGKQKLSLGWQGWAMLAMVAITAVGTIGLWVLPHLK